MDKLQMELCPETGICSIIKADGKKVDLLPHEVRELQAAGDDPEAVKQALASVDAEFAESLDGTEVGQIADNLK